MFFCYLNEFTAHGQPFFLPQGAFWFPISNEHEAMPPENVKSTTELPIQAHYRQILKENQSGEEQVKASQSSKVEEKQDGGIKKNSKKNKEEQEYMPKKHNSKMDKKKIKQDARRNIVPNIVHQLFCFIQKKSRSYKIVQRYFLNKQNPYFTVSEKASRFYNYQRLLKAKNNNYINFAGLWELRQYQEPSFEVYSREQQDEFLKVTRILVRHFLHYELNLIIMTSLRMKNWSRQFYLEAKRKISDFLHEELQIL